MADIKWKMEGEILRRSWWRRFGHWDRPDRKM